MMPKRVITVVRNGVPVKVCLYTVFVYPPGTLELRDLFIYATGELECEGIPYTIEDVVRLARDGLLLTTPPEGEYVTIRHQMVFQATNVVKVIQEPEFVKEIADILRELNGQPTSLDICREAYAQFEREPTESNRQSLKTAFERMPRHYDIWVVPFPKHPSEIYNAVYGSQEDPRPPSSF